MNNITRKLITMGLSLGLALTTLTGCDYFESHKNLENKRFEVAAEMSDDAGVKFFKLKSMKTYTANGEYFASFIGHHDTLFTPGWHGGTYENHKDYNIVYKIDETAFNELNKYKKGFASFYSFKEDGLEAIQSVIDKFDVVDIEEILDEEDLCK